MEHAEYISSDEYDQSETVGETQPDMVPSKRRKLRAECWKHMDEIIDEDGVRKARCKYCQTLLCSGSGKNGTSSLNKHYKNCDKNPNKQPKDQPNLVMKKDEDGQGTLRTWKYNPVLVRKLLVKMIIEDELSFSFVERPGFRGFMEALCPSFKVPSRFTVARDILDLYLDEKKKLRNFFIENKQRVSFTTDTWTSIQRINYMCLTAHFIDENWQFHKRIINFKPILSHKGDDIARAIQECLDEWGIERVMTFTLDNASSNNVAASILKNKLSKNMICQGKYLHVRCVAHIINLIVQDGLKANSMTIDCIRNAVKHIRASPARLAAFKACVIEKKIESKGGLCLDVSTRWNSTFDMLERAIQLKDAIELYARRNSSFRQELDDVPDSFVWNFATKITKLLAFFKKKTVDLSCSSYVIANELFAEVMDIGENLSKFFSEKDKDQEILEMLALMKNKFAKYFEDEGMINKVFEIASILDPRVKINMVEIRIVEECELMKKDGLLMSKEAFDEKVKELLEVEKSEMKLIIQEYDDSNEVVSNVPVTTVESSRGQKLWMDKLQKFRGGNGQLSSKKTELDRYLLEDLEEMKEKFDILLWWRVNSTRYPTLARMAKDILAIPVSTVASESAFSTSGRVVDPYRSSLSPIIVEALICTQDWIRTVKKPINEDEEYEKFDEFGKDVFDKIEKMKIE